VTGSTHPGIMEYVESALQGERATNRTRGGVDSGFTLVLLTRHILDSSPLRLTTAGRKSARSLVRIGQWSDRFGPTLIPDPLVRTLLAGKVG
jgi:hypothetical protein